MWIVVEYIHWSRRGPPSTCSANLSRGLRGAAVLSHRHYLERYCLAAATSLCVTLGDPRLAAGYPAGRDGCRCPLARY